MKSTVRYIYTTLNALLVFLVVVIAQTSNVYAQDQLPFREYTNPDEIITFDRSTSFVEAIEIINQFVQEYENKFIVDRSGYAGEIGVTLPAMHWKEALRYILRFQNLELVINEEFYEIRQPVTTTDDGALAANEPVQGALPGPASTLANKGTREVRINATFFEGNRRALEEVGIDWSTLTDNVPANISDFISGDGTESIPQTAFTDQFVSINSSNANQVSQNVFNALVNFGEVGPVNVQALFSAFESNNLGRTLATPSIKVVEGREGRIQVGQDFSIKQRDFAGNVTDQFFSVGTILTVTPTVIVDNDTTFIHLNLQVERSSAQPDAVSTIINKQTAETQTLLLNGEATSIAGLYQTDEFKVRRGVPILKDLPAWFFGLRYLFGYNSNDYVENELVILIQAELEKSLTERIDEKLRSKNEVLDSEREWFRNSMDYVLEEAQAQVPPLPEVDNKAEEKTIADSEAEEDKETEKPSDQDEKPEEKKDDDKVAELTEEQKKDIEELGMPVKDAELMVVVPKAFNLDEYLKKQEEGTIEAAEEDKSLRYFVIGGSFIVPDNAYRFEKLLDSEGYVSRILYNPSSRFNYVAYYGFSSLDEAINETKRVRQEINPEAWLFTFDPESMRYKSEE